MKSFKYITKKNSNSLLDDYDCDYIKDNKCVVIQSNNHSVVHLFDSFKEFIDFNNNLSNQEMIYKEIIFADDTQKFKLDIDIKNNNEIDIINLLECCVEAVKTILKIPNCKVYHYDSSGEGIISKHIIFDIYFSNVFKCKALYDRVILYLDRLNIKDTLTSIVDGSVYKTIQGFRLPNHRKYNSNRIKKPCNDTINIEMGMIKNYNKTYEPLLFDERVHEECITTDYYSLSNDILDNDTIKEILKLSEEYTKHFIYRNSINNMLIFDRVTAGECSICKRVHDCENSLYIIYTDKNIKIHCRRNDFNFININIKNPSINNNITYTKSQVIKNNLFKIFIDTNEMFDGYFNENNKIIFNSDTIKPFEFINDTNTLIIHSNVKTGKTKMLKSHIENNNYKNIIFISFRILFTCEIKSKFDKIHSYIDIKDKQISLNKYKKIIIQIESLKKILIDDDINLLVLDECESIISQFSSPYIKDVKLIWSIFIMLLNSSEKIILMDANITKRTVDMISSIKEKKEMCYYKNCYLNLTNDKYYITFNFVIFMSKLVELVNDGKKIVIPTNSLKCAKIIKEKLSEYVNEIILYSSESCDYEKNKHLSDVNDYWCKYKIVIYTPCITAGVSFEKTHFNYVFGYFVNTSCDVYTIYQMLYRVRNISSNETYLMFDIFNNNNIQKSFDLKDIKEEIKYKFEHIISTILECKIIYNKDEKITNNLIDYDSVHFKVWYNNYVINKVSNLYLAYMFVGIIKNYGCKIQFLNKHNVDTKSLIEINTDYILNKISKNNNIEILNVDDIGTEEYEKLLSRTMLSAYEKIKLKKFFIKSIYNVNTLSLNMLEKYNNKKNIQKAINLRNVKNFTINCKKIMSTRTYNSNYTIYDYKLNVYTCYLKIINVLTSIGLDIYSMPFSIDTKIFKSLVENTMMFTIDNIKFITGKELYYEKETFETIIKKINEIINNYWDLIIEENNKNFTLSKGYLFNYGLPVTISENCNVTN